jgi:hypothetical protein
MLRRVFIGVAIRHLIFSFFFDRLRRASCVEFILRILRLFAFAVKIFFGGFSLVGSATAHEFHACAAYGVIFEALR